MNTYIYTYLIHIYIYTLYIITGEVRRRCVARNLCKFSSRNHVRSAAAFSRESQPSSKTRIARATPYIHSSVVQRNVLKGGGNYEVRDCRSTDSGVTEFLDVRRRTGRLRAESARRIQRRGLLGGRAPYPISVKKGIRFQSYFFFTNLHCYYVC